MKSSAPKKTTVKAASKAIPKTKVATVKKVAPKKTAVNAVKKVPVLKQAALKPLSPITIKPKTAPIKSAMPEFIVPLAVKKTISNEVEKVLTPTNKIAVAPLEAKKGELDDNCCGGHCDHNANKHSFSRAIIGLLLIIFGLIYLGKNLGILPFDINLNVYNFWPLIIIVIGFLLVNKKAKLSILAGVIGAATFALIIYFIML